MPTTPHTSFGATPLSTRDVMDIAGVSRRSLERYEQVGLLVPHRTAGSLRAKKYWSIDQAQLIECVRILQHAGLSLEEITSLADEGATALLGATQNQCAQDVRAARRQFKASEKDLRRCNGAREVGTRSGLYVRTFPQRWVAMAQLAAPGAPSPSVEECARLFVELYAVAHVVGWCVMGEATVLESVSSPNESGALYACIGLVSPPMPSWRTGELLDGGCYYSIAPGQVMPCAGACTMCAHFGRMPSTEERFRWNRYESEAGMAKQGVSPGNVACNKVACGQDTGSNAAGATPFSYGIWSDNPVCENDPASICTLRPRIMPNNVQLPLGITACALPGGTYLCLQCSEGEEAAVRERMIGIACALPRREFTLDDEQLLFERRYLRTHAQVDDAAGVAPACATATGAVTAGTTAAGVATTGVAPAGAPVGADTTGASTAGATTYTATTGVAMDAVTTAGAAAASTSANAPFSPLFPTTGMTGLPGAVLPVNVSMDNLHKVVLPTGMGLAPDASGFCLSHTLVPADGRNDTPRTEVRLQVDASALASSTAPWLAQFGLWE